MKVAVPLEKNIFGPLGITTAASAVDAGIQKKIHGSGCPSSSAPQVTTSIISNEELNGILKIVQALEDSAILLKGVTLESRIIVPLPLPLIVNFSIFFQTGHLYNLYSNPPPPNY